MASKYPEPAEYEDFLYDPFKNDLDDEDNVKDPLLRTENINDLPVCVFHKLFLYLPNWETISIRRVCRYWNIAVKTCTKFLEKTYILITSDRGMTSMQMREYLDSFDPVWRRIRIQRTQNFLEALPMPFIQNLLHIELVGCQKSITWDQLLNLLYSTPLLEEFILRKSLKSINQSIQDLKNSLFQTLNEFQSTSHRFPDLKAIEFRVKDPADALLMINLITRRCTKLQKVSYGCRTPSIGIHGNSDIRETVEELYRTINLMLSKYANTLELFHSYLLDPVRQREGAVTLLDAFCQNVIGNVNRRQVALKLNSFCIYGGELKHNVEQNVEILKTFISSQTSLQKIILPRIRFMSEPDYFSLIEAIPRTIRCIRIPTDFGMPKSLFVDFKALNEFYIETHGCSDLQTILPPRRALPHVRTVSFYNCSSWICQDVRMMRIIETFPYLTELLIKDDGEPPCFHVEDLDLQNICRCLSVIRKIHITSCDCVTDFGISGISDEECKRLNEHVEDFWPLPGTRIGYPFSALTCLQYLCLQDLGFKVTDVSLSFGIACNRLRVMTLEGYPKVSLLGVNRLACNNPNLKHWQLNFHNEVISNFVTQLQGMDESHQDSIPVPLPEEELQENEETDRED